MPRVRGWNLVSSGLELKFAGLLLFVAIPLLGVTLWLLELRLQWLMLGVVLSALPDFVGRCMCLSAPISSKLTIALSVVFQAFAFVGVISFGLIGGIEGTTAGILIAVILQTVSAALFTQFLQAAGVELGRPDVTKRAASLNWRIVYSLIATSGLGLFVLIAACLVLVAGCITCGVGFYVAAPMAAVALIPLLLLEIGVLMAMYWAYGATLLSLRSAIRHNDLMKQADRISDFEEPFE